MVERGLLGNLCGRGNGGRTRLTPIASSTVRATILDLSGENDPAPQATLVTLSRSNVGDPRTRASEPYLIRAIITYGTGKSSSQVTLDYVQGARICLDASSVRVDAEYISTGVNANELGPPADLGATLIYGNMGPQATLTELPVTLLTTASSNAALIPKFAREMAFYVTNDSGTPMSVQFAPGGKAAGNITQTATAGTWLTIPNGVDSYVITNNSVNAVQFTPIFKLFV